MILVLVDHNSCLASANTIKIMLLPKAFGAKRPSHLSHEANCLQLFAISRSSRRTFRHDDAFDNAFSTSFFMSALFLGAVPWEMTKTFVSLLIQWEWPGLTKSVGDRGRQFFSYPSPRHHAV